MGAFGYFYSKEHIYSKDILKLEILGPQEANTFDEVNYIVKFKNNGNFRLEDLKLIFQYPENTFLEGSEIKEMKLDDLYPGQEKTISFKGRLVGKEGEIKIAKAKLIFRPKELKSFYESDTTFTTTIKKFPLSFDLDIPPKAESGKDIQLTINYFSNLDFPVSSLGIMVAYPDGFDFKKSEPSSLDKEQFEIGTLNKGEGGRIKIQGKLSGNIKEEKVFKVTLGVWENGNFVPVKEIAKAVEITTPSLYISQEINGNPQYIASPGDLLHYIIGVRNIGEEPQTDLFVVVKLEGKAFDLSTLKSVEGDFKPGDNSLIFDWRKVSDLQYIEPQQEVKLEFWVKLKDDWGYLPEDKNSTITTKIYISQIREEFETKVNSRLLVIQKGYFQDEIFGNSGPIPPRVREGTTYTITWQVKNYYNKVKDVKVKSNLPKNVELTGKIFPENETSEFTYDPQSREIVWSIGDLDPGTLENGPNISFQVKLTPSEDQRGKTPNIIEEAKILGEDEFTGEEIEDTSPSINTTLSDDETVSDKEGVVQ